MTKVRINRIELSRRELIDKHFEMAAALQRMEKSLSEILIIVVDGPKTPNGRAVLKNCEKAYDAVKVMQIYLADCIPEDTVHFFGSSEIYHNQLSYDDYKEEIEYVLRTESP